MRLGSRVLVAVVGLVAMLGAAHPIPPCTPVKVDTSGWSTAHFNRRLLFKFPQSFKPGPVITCAGTCRAWIDGDRQLFVTTGEHDGFGKDERTAEGYSECVDTLAGTAFLLMTSYRPSKYDPTKGAYCAYAVEGAVSLQELPKMTTIVRGSSLRESDLRLFLAIFRTLQVDSTTEPKR